MSEPDWWRGAVLYQIYPRSFVDSNGDGIGDLPGIIAHLDYVASLGADGIWLSPIFVSPMEDFGYDVADYVNVDPMFGTLADFRALLDAAHARGLKIILDQVYSHSSNRHPWFEESRQDRSNASADWYVWADPKPDGTPPNNWMASFGGPAWTWEPRRRQYYLHNFLPSQPDLNLHNLAVQDALLAAARFWLELGVDGFRLDVANFYTHDRQLRDNPPRPSYSGPRAHAYQQRIHNISQPETLGFLSRLRALLDSFGARMAVAEIVCERQLERVIEYTSGADRLHTAYSFALLGAPMPPAALRDAVSEILDAAGQPWPAWAFSNHDVPRIASRWAVPGEETSRVARLFLAVLLTLRGTVFLYQGEELGLPQPDLPREALRDPEALNNYPFGGGRDGARTPMPWEDSPGAGFTSGQPWLPVGNGHRALSVARQERNPDSVLVFTRHVMALRRSLPGFRTSSLCWLDSPADVVAFERAGEGWTLCCVFNFSPTGAIDWKDDLSSAAISTGVEGARLLPRGFALSLSWKGDRPGAPPDRSESIRRSAENGPPASG